MGWGDSILMVRGLRAETQGATEDMKALAKVSAGLRILGLIGTPQPQNVADSLPGEESTFSALAARRDELEKLIREFETRLGQAAENSPEAKEITDYLAVLRSRLADLANIGAVDIDELRSIRETQSTVTQQVESALFGLRSSASKTVRTVQDSLDGIEEGVERTSLTAGESVEDTSMFSDELRTLLGNAGDVSGAFFKDPKSKFGDPSGNVQGGGFVGIERAREWVEVFQRLMKVNDDTTLNPFLRGEAQRNLQSLTRAFQTFFPQLGSIERLAKELAAFNLRSATGSGGGLVPRTGTTSRGEKCTCTPSTSSSILQASGARR